MTSVFLTSVSCGRRKKSRLRSWGPFYDVLCAVPDSAAVCVLINMSWDVAGSRAQVCIYDEELTGWCYWSAASTCAVCGIVEPRSSPEGMMRCLRKGLG